MDSSLLPPYDYMEIRNTERLEEFSPLRHKVDDAGEVCLEGLHLALQVRAGAGQVRHVMVTPAHHRCRQNIAKYGLLFQAYVEAKG